MTNKVKQLNKKGTKPISSYHSRSDPSRLHMKSSLNFLDLFAGAGGLSEGFIQSGYNPIAHVEMNSAACFTVRTRLAYHWLKNHNAQELYISYLNGEIRRKCFYDAIPRSIIDSVINTEISKISLPEIFARIDSLLVNKKLDLIVGGPPCQAYSIVGRSRDQSGMIGDKRNYLYIYYAEFLKRYRPRYFVFENVTGLLSAHDRSNRKYFDSMRILFTECGYETEFRILSSEEYGVLQNRKRIILVGKLGKQTGFFPEPEKWIPDVLVNEVFKDLPVLSSGEGSSMPCTLKKYRGTWQYDAGIRNDDIPVTWHQARSNTEQDKEIYRIVVNLWNNQMTRLNYNDLPKYLKTHKVRDSFLDRFKVVASNLPYSHTVVAHIARDGHYYIHPDISQNRSITPREAARIQSFPDDYYFESQTSAPSRTCAYRQIGNAVPVLLAKKIASKLLEQWK